MKICRLMVLLALIVAATLAAVVVGSLLLDPIKLDFSLVGRIRYHLGVEAPDPDDAIAAVYAAMLYAAAGCMTVLIGRQMHAVYREKHGGLTDAYRLRSCRLQVFLGAATAVLLLGAGGLLVVRAEIAYMMMAMIPGAALAVRWAMHMWKARRQGE